MKKYLLAVLLAAAPTLSWSAAALPLYFQVVKTGFTCQKENLNQQTNYANGYGGAAYLFYWSDNVIENVDVVWNATKTNLYTASGAIRGSAGDGEIRLQAPIIYYVLTNDGWKRRVIPVANYKTGLGNATRMVNVNSWLNVSLPTRKLQFWLAGRNARLSDTIKVDGKLKTINFTCTSKYGW